MGKKKKRVIKSDSTNVSDPDDGYAQIQEPDKFIWSSDDVSGLVWLDDHEYTGTVPPSR